jgi:nucleotide-binding universal stress UspA family protein
MRKKILIAIDGSEPAMDAARYAFQLAEKMDLGLVGLRVVDIDRYASDWQAVRDKVTGELEEHAERILNELSDEARKHGLEVDLQVRHGDSSREIIRFAQEDHDVALIVLGATGRRRLGRQLIGSTAERVVRQVGRDLPCAVIITPSVSTTPEARLTLG